MKQTAIVILLCSATCMGAQKKNEKVDLKKMAREGWTVLFDGKTMKGWKANENKETWKLVDGTLQCKGKRSHLFYVGKSDKPVEYRDFELRAQVKTTKGSNSGIYFHTKYQPKGWPKFGYECQVNITQGDPKKTSSLYAVKNVNADQLKGVIKDGEWYWQTVVVKGRKVTLKVNGKTMVEFTEEEGRKAFSKDFERRLGKGTFALQGHDPKSVVQFRNIMVKPLK